MNAPPMPPSPKPGSTAARILEAADHILVETGYDGVSMSAVAEAAGVNKASVFYYFNSKAELIERVLERYYAAHLAALRDAFGADGTVGERLHQLVDAYLDFMDANRRYPRLIQQLVAGGGEHDAFIRRSLGPLFEWTAQALSTVAPDRGPQAARHFFVSFSGIVTNYYSYARVLGPLWGADPLSESALAERREHVHWLVDTLVQRLSTDADR